MSLDKIKLPLSALIDACHLTRRIAAGTASALRALFGQGEHLCLL